MFKRNIFNELMKWKNHLKKIAIRFWSHPASSDKIALPSGKEFTLYNFPFYYAGQLEKLLMKIL